MEKRSLWLALAGTEPLPLLCVPCNRIHHFTVGFGRLQAGRFLVYRAYRSLSILISSIILISSTPALLAQENQDIPSAERVRSLNNRLLGLHARSHETGRKQILARSAEDESIRNEAA